MSILAILDFNNIQENSKDKYLNKLTLDDLFLEINTRILPKVSFSVKIISLRYSKSGVKFLKNQKSMM